MQAKGINGEGAIEVNAAFSSSSFLATLGLVFSDTGVLTFLYCEMGKIIMELCMVLLFY